MLLIFSKNPIVVLAAVRLRIRAVISILSMYTYSIAHKKKTLFAFACVLRATLLNVPAISWVVY